MSLTSAEKIRAIMKRRGVTLSALAKALDTSRQNLSNKLERDNLSRKEIVEIAAALDCSYEEVFTMNDTGEKI